MIQPHIRVTIDGSPFGISIVHIPTGAELSVSGIDFHWSVDRFHEETLVLTFPRGTFEVQVAARPDIQGEGVEQDKERPTAYVRETDTPGE